MALRSTGNAPQDGLQPRSENWYRVVSAALENDLDFGQLRAHPLRHGSPFHPKSSLAVLPTEVGKPQKVKGLRLSPVPSPAPFPSKMTELDQARFVRVQLEPELGEALPESVEKMLGFPMVLEPKNDVVSVPDDAHSAPAVLTSPLVGPGSKT